MASNRNHRVAVSLMNRSISQRGIALSGREMRIALSQHRHPNGSAIAECVIDEYVGWAEQRRKFFEKKTADDAKRTVHLAEMKKRNEELAKAAAKEEQARTEREKFIIEGAALAVKQEPSYVGAIRFAIGAMLGTRSFRAFNHRFAARGS